MEQGHSKDIKLSNKEFEIFVKFLGQAHELFCFSKRGHDKIVGEPWENFEDAWTVILIALRRSYLIGLARLYDSKSSKGRLNISIWRAIPKSDFTLDNQNTTENLTKIRNRVIAHLDSQEILLGKELEEQYGIDFEGEKLRSLIQQTYALLDLERKKYGYTKALDYLEERRVAEKKFDEWYKRFSYGGFKPWLFFKKLFTQNRF